MMKEDGRPSGGVGTESVRHLPLIPSTLLQLPVQAVMAGRAEDINQKSGCVTETAFKLGGTLKERENACHGALESLGKVGGDLPH